MYGQYDDAPESELIHGWVTEAIQQQGFDFYYLPRSATKFDVFWGEDVLSKFDQAYLLEGFVEEAGDGWQGGELLAEFGAVERSSTTVRIGQRRYKEVTGNDYPLEGDLIYFKGMFFYELWEIRFVENKKQFFPNGGLPSFVLNISLFDPSGETFNTGITELDSAMDTFMPHNLDSLDKLTDVLRADNEAIEDESDTIVPEQPDNYWGEFSNVP